MFFICRYIINTPAHKLMPQLEQEVREGKKIRCLACCGNSFSAVMDDSTGYQLQEFVMGGGLVEESLENFVEEHWKDDAFITSIAGLTLTWIPEVSPEFVRFHHLKLNGTAPIVILCSSNSAQ